MGHGSATPQTIPVAIPAQREMKNQEGVDNSGFAFGPPSLIFPYLLKPAHTKG